MAYQLRPATEHDFHFLYELHRESLREAVDATWGWDEADQERRFRSRWEPAARQVIVVDGEDVGVLQLKERADELYLGLIEIMPAHQGQGLGTAILQDLLNQAREMGKPVTLAVLKANDAARRLYERLGFVVEHEDEARYLMRYDSA